MCVYFCWVCKFYILKYTIIQFRFRFHATRLISYCAASRNSLVFMTHCSFFYYFLINFTLYPAYNTVDRGNRRNRLFYEACLVEWWNVTPPLPRPTSRCQSGENGNEKVHFCGDCRPTLHLHHDDPHSSNLNPMVYLYMVWPYGFFNHLNSMIT